MSLKNKLINVVATCGILACTASFSGCADTRELSNDEVAAYLVTGRIDYFNGDKSRRELSNEEAAMIYLLTR